MKNLRWLFLLIFTFSATTTSGQYADDNVTNRKARDPFKANKKSGKTDSSSISKTISLSDSVPEEKTIAGVNISGIQIINAVSDSSLLGYVQTGMFNQWTEAIPDKPYTEYLQSYVDRRYNTMYKEGATKLVWIIQELRISERTFNMSEKGFLHLKAISFAGDNNDTFRLITELDTILEKGGMDVSRKHRENIIHALQILLDQSLTKNVSVYKATYPVYTMSAIRAKALQRYNVPALQEKDHPDGIYLTFKEFLNDKPSFSNVTYSLEHDSVRFYHTDNNGNKIFIDKFWGVRKNGILLKQYYDLLIPIEQKQNGISLTNNLLLARQRNNAVIPAMVGGGLLGGAIAGAAMGGSSMAYVLPLVKNIPYIRKKVPWATRVDIETGEFAL
ncbi:hypothetical protein L3C95_09545 [Chitinophaga filiformis]|uniref:hypothetical protein n=1 Tax=Chitinophaga filiformis TaxID=104663 RepID=UPI001F159381|nr:hypothetical protein [Chitinophaga filiformis]MCF6403117.1 hypothetical protein [Chitinophaga filiformis]